MVRRTKEEAQETRNRIIDAATSAFAVPIASSAAIRASVART